jgi:hypothetical protein
MNNLLLISLLSLSLVACTKATPTNKPIEPVGLVHQSVPAADRAVVNQFWQSLPKDLRAKINPERLNIALVMDGRVVSNRPGVGARVGKIDPEKSVINFQDGDTLPAPTEDSATPNAPSTNTLSALGTNYGKCKGSDGPYYRSWTKRGYGGISADLFMKRPEFGQDEERYGFYAYLGGQLANGGIEADGGLVAYKGRRKQDKPKLRMFVKSNIEYAEYRENGVTLGLAFGVPYHTYFSSSFLNPNPTGDPTKRNFMYIMTKVGNADYRVVGAQSPAIFTEGPNQDQYFKRMVTIATGNKSYGKKPFKAKARHMGSINTHGVAEWYQDPVNPSLTGFVSATWKPSMASPRDCQVPASVVNPSKNAATAARFVVNINMNR